jgi:hypothetical protein
VTVLKQMLLATNRQLLKFAAKRRVDLKLLGKHLTKSELKRSLKLVLVSPSNVPKPKLKSLRLGLLLKAKLFRQ